MGRKKNETTTSAPPSKESDLKPTIDVSVYPPGASVPDLKDNKRRGSVRRTFGASTQPTNIVPGTPSSSLPSPAGTPQTRAQVVLKSGKEPSKPPEQTVLTQLATKKDNNNIVATVEVPAPQAIITGGSQIINRAGDAPPDQVYPVDGEGQLPNYSPFVPDPSNPRVMYGPYPSELGFKPFGFLPPFRNQPDYGFRNVMEMGPHPWWHPYGRRRRTWYDFPPRHPWAPEPVQYVPVAPLWARPRMVRDLYSLESEIFNEEDPRDNEPQGFLPYSYYNSYPYNYNYGSMYPYSPPPPPPLPPYAYGYPWYQPYSLPPPPPPPSPPIPPPYPLQEIHPVTPGSVGEQSDDVSRPGETSAPQHHKRHHKHRQVDSPFMWNQQVPHVQQPWPRPTHHHYVGHQSPVQWHYPSAVGPPLAIQSPSGPQEPPPPPPPPPPPAGGDESYERVV